jgi:hypothetical protein
VDVAVTPASDEWSGVDGLSFGWDESPTTAPDTVKDAEETTAGTTSPPLPDGRHYLHLRTVDRAGNWSAPLHVGPFSIDTRAPGEAQVSGYAPFQSERPFRVGWSANDAASGVASYDVRYRRAPLAGDFRPDVVWRGGETAAGAAFTALPGSTYCLSARPRMRPETGALSGARPAPRSLPAPARSRGRAHGYGSFVAATTLGRIS